MKITYDKKADAMYIALEKLSRGCAKQTFPLNENIILDLNSEKRIIGIEILDASKNLSKNSLKTAEAVV